MNAALEQTCRQISAMARWHDEHANELQQLGFTARRMVLRGAPRMAVNRWYEQACNNLRGHNEWSNVA